MQFMLAVIFIAGSLLIGSVIPAPRQLAQASPTPIPEVANTPSPPSLPTPTPTPTATPIVVKVILQTPKPQFDPLKIAKKIREKYPDAYPDISDETLGNLYIKKYGTDELLPGYLIDSGPSSNSNYRPPINCTSNMIAGQIFTNCY